MHVRVNNNNVIKYENCDTLFNIPPLPVLLSAEGTGRVRERREVQHGDQSTGLFTEIPGT